MNSQDDGWGEAATETSAPAPAPAPASAPVSNNSNNDGWGEPAPSAPADNGWGEAGASNGGNGANNNDGWFDAPVPPSSRPPKKEASDIQLQDDTEGLITSTFQVEVKLADLQGDPNSPLYSVQSFKQLNL
ncbi:ATP-dependent RNA helicase DBP5 [Cryptococcus gattii EJB2]|nr:ATP-dependent RNA helicase DBP5 [Cryptococcus gattii EJB2]